VSDFASLLSETQERVETAQQVLSGVETGLEVVQRVEAVAERTRRGLRWAGVVILGCFLGLGIVLLVSHRRLAGDTAIPEAESSEELPDAYG
jgi:hypothetical protein